jgi:hypothetical protein
MATQARVIDFDSPEKETVGTILDLRAYYPDSAPSTRKFMTVVVALAKDSEEEAAEHHIITIINAGYGYFFKRQGAGFGELKGKWLRVK